MAPMDTLPSLLATLTESLDTASLSIPESFAIAPPAEGVSLLDTKNELLLAYLQNLVFLIIIKLRNLKPREKESSQGESADVVRKKLVELRIYLEKGVRPLEGKLKYQLDKLLAAASEADAARNSAIVKHTTAKQHDRKSQADDSEEDSDIARIPEPAEIADLSHRPNPAAFVRPARYARGDRKDTDGVYKPPRIAPTSLPTTDRDAQRSKRPRKSGTVDDFIREEMTDAPIAEPSIGAGSGLRGREKEKDDERRAYEEQKLVRLPEQKKKRRIGGGGEDLDLGFGGLGDVDFGDVRGKGRKRRKDGGGEGERIGERWERRVQKGVGRKRR